MPANPQAEGVSPSVIKESATSQMIESFHSEVTTPIDPYKSAFESESVARVCKKPNRMHIHQKPGCISGTPFIHTATAAKGSRNANRPSTLMYSSSLWPMDFIDAFLSTCRGPL